MYTIQQSLDAMWCIGLDSLLRESVVTSRNGDMREILGATFVLEEPSACWLYNERRNASPVYAAAEALWYFLETDSIDMIKRYAPQYENFADGGRAYGAYGPRISSPVKQLECVIKVLRDAPHSRQAVVVMWRNTDLEIITTENAVKDVPCTLTWQFLVRDNKLHMHCSMRSQDIWLGMPYDVFANCTIMKLIANELNLEPGHYKHSVGSFHLYEKHFKAAEEALASSPDSMYDGLDSDDCLWLESDDFLSSVKLAAHQQERARKLNSTERIQSVGNIGDALMMCCIEDLGTPKSKAYKKVLIPDPPMMNIYHRFKELKNDRTRGSRLDGKNDSVSGDSENSA